MAYRPMLPLRDDSLDRAAKRILQMLEAEGANNPLSAPLRSEERLDGRSSSVLPYALSEEAGASPRRHLASTPRQVPFTFDGLLDALWRNENGVAASAAAALVPYRGSDLLTVVNYTNPYNQRLTNDREPGLGSQSEPGMGEVQALPSAAYPGLLEVAGIVLGPCRLVKDYDLYCTYKCPGRVKTVRNKWWPLPCKYNPAPGEVPELEGAPPDPFPTLPRLPRLPRGGGGGGGGMGGK